MRVRRVFVVDGYDLIRGCEVMCVGYSSRSSYLSIAYQHDILDIPFNKTSIKLPDNTPSLCLEASINSDYSHSLTGVKKPWEISPEQLLVADI